jgi:hypothetical protein
LLSVSAVPPTSIAVLIIVIIVAGVVVCLLLVLLVRARRTVEKLNAQSGRESEFVSAAEQWRRALLRDLLSDVAQLLTESADVVFHW